MFVLDGKPLALDVAFTHNDIQYPANWLRLASQEERAAIGITEEPDPQPYDQGFFWAPGIPKDHGALVTQWVGQVKATAASLLAATDWMVTRAVDPSSAKAVPQEILDERTAVRIKSNEKEAAIEATTTTEELAAYVRGPEFPVWLEQQKTVLVRARNEDGTFAADNPSTLQDEAWAEVPISEA